MSVKKQCVAVYPGCYLTVSMTFVYEQLKAALEGFDLIVLAATVDNLNLFPFDPIYVKKRGPIEGLYCKVSRRVLGKSHVLSYSQKKAWRDALTQHDVRLVHAHFGPSGIGILPVVRKLGIPLLTTFHGIDASRDLRNSTYVASLQGLFRYSHVIAVSKVMAQNLESIGLRSSQADVLYCGVSVDAFKYVERVPIREKVRRGEQIEFLQVSNFVEKKGHEYTVRAFKKFLSRCGKARLTFGGDGPLRNEVQELCDSLGIREKVRFLGKVVREEVITLMRQADVFVHHSVTAENGDQEGIPTSIMEAMSTGLVAISTRHAGIPELLDDEVTGFVVEERDVDAYAQKMIGTLECGNEVGRQASEKISVQFNSELQKRKLLQIYTKRIEENGG